MTVAQFVVDLVTAVATVGAVVVALWVASRDSRRRDAESRDALAAQARLITILPRETSEGMVQGGVSNSSDKMIHELRLESVTAIRDPRATSWFLDPAHAPLQEVGGNLIASALVPNDGRTVRVCFVDARGERVNAEETDRSIFTISYTDATGLRWRREGAGEPARVLGSPRHAESLPPVLGVLGVDSR